MGTLRATSSFAAGDFVSQIDALGADQALEPPDTQLAAGPNNVVEATNDNLSVWTVSGARKFFPPFGAFDLNALFSVDPGYAITDPEILYDTQSRTYFLTALAINQSFQSKLYAAVSGNSDPLGSWTFYEVTPFQTPPTDEILDQPRLGTTDSQVVITYDDYQGCRANPTTCTSGFDGVMVLPKPAMLAAQSLSGSNTPGFLEEPGHFGLRPARALSSSSTAYLVGNQNLDGSPAVTGNTIGLWTIVGNTQSTWMLQGPVSLGLQKPTWFFPIPAPQPGTDALLDVGDGRIGSASWANGTLWAGFSDGCGISAGAATGTCTRWAEISTATPTLTQDTEFGGGGDYVYYPAGVTDSAGNLIWTYTHSNTSLFPSVEAAGQLAANPATQSNAVTVGAGTAPYDSRPCGGGGVGAASVMRWGDYSGAAIDPTDPTYVWVAAEDMTYSYSSCDWQTGIGRVTFNSITAPLYSFSPSPIANPGILNPSQTVTVTLTVRGASSTNVVNVWLGFNNGNDGATARVGAASLGQPPTEFQTNSSGQIAITYTAAVTPPAAGEDVISASDQPPGSDVTAIDAYNYAACPASLTLDPATTIAPQGSLASGEKAAISITADDGSAAHTPIPGAKVQLSFTSIPGAPGTSGSATGPDGAPLTAAGTVYTTDNSGQILVTYQAATVSTAGTDTVSAQVSGCPNPLAQTSTYAYKPGSSFYFAEGFTGSGFTEQLSMLMPNQSGLAQIFFYTQSASGFVYWPMTAGVVSILPVNQIVGANQDVSAQVVLPGPGVVERLMSFNNGTWHGSTDQVGVGRPRTEWDFAEGSTLSAFNEFLSLQNPTSNIANVTLNYATDAGAHPTKQLVLPPNSRTTIEVYQGDLSNNSSCLPLTTCGVGPGIVGVSVQVLSDQPIVAERPMYVMNYSFGYGPIKDGHDAFGANLPGTVWDFAEGTTLNGFNEYLTIQNPGLTAANVNLHYLYDLGTKDVNMVVGPRSRQTALVFDPAHFGIGRAYVGVSTVVTSDLPIVAERPMYIYENFGSGAVAGAHDVVGATGPANLFGFSEASTLAGNNDYLSIENPDVLAQTVTLTYYLDFGTETTTITVPAQSRHTVQLFSTSEGVGAGDYPIGIVATSSRLVLIEKPTYSSNSNTYGATDTLGYVPPNGF